MSVSIPIPKKGNAKECSSYHTTAPIPHAIKAMLKILQARLQQYVKQEMPDVQAGFEEAVEPKLKLSIYVGSKEKQENLLRNLYAVREATVRSEQAKMNRLKIGKEIHQNYILAPCDNLQ